MPQLINSTIDKVCFTIALSKKYDKIVLEFRKRGMLLNMTEKTENDIKHAMRVFARYSRADYRHSEQELGAEQELARWVIASSARITGSLARDVDLTFSTSDSPLASSVPNNRLLSIVADAMVYLGI